MESCTRTDSRKVRRTCCTKDRLFKVSYESGRNERITLSRFLLKFLCVFRYRTESDWNLEACTDYEFMFNNKLERPVDNIHVDEDGSIYATTLTKVLDFMEAGKEGGASGSPAVEIMRITNDTSAGTGRYKAELVFADDGKIVSSSTTAAPYRGKLVLTGESFNVLHCPNVLASASTSSRSIFRLLKRPPVDFRVSPSTSQAFSREKSVSATSTE